MIKYLGKLSRRQVNDLYGSSRAGIVVYQPARNHYYSQPIKLFEFMAAGLPVIASDYPLWREIVECNGCGICVDPTNANEVKSAIVKLLADPVKGQEMGINGRKAVERQFNWVNEAKELVMLYHLLDVEENDGS